MIMRTHVYQEADIEELCSTHYQEFVGAVDQLLKVRQETVALKDAIESLNTKMNESGHDLISRRREVISLKRVVANCEAAVQAIKSCLFVLDVCSKINSQVACGKYYSALRV